MVFTILLTIGIIHSSQQTTAFKEQQNDPNRSPSQD
nr:MAG TPA: hypothetical protein [Caudoviricetes sp.]